MTNGTTFPMNTVPKVSSGQCMNESREVYQGYLEKIALIFFPLNCHLYL
jgi:hypothetical protein